MHSLAGIVCMLAPLVILGQQSKAGEQTDPGDAIFSSETRLVPLNVTVTDKSGRLVTDLPQSAFQVFENGVQQTIRLFKREDVPVSMGLIIDNSGSMRGKRALGILVESTGGQVFYPKDVASNTG
jgi:Ca-activated chloride channel homolog